MAMKKDVPAQTRNQRRRGSYPEPARSIAQADKLYCQVLAAGWAVMCLVALAQVIA